MGRRSNLPQYFQLHKDAYRIRVQVPAPLQAIVGKRELVKALGTACLREAEKVEREYQIIGEFKCLLSRAERQLRGEALSAISLQVNVPVGRLSETFLRNSIIAAAMLDAKSLRLSSPNVDVVPANIGELAHITFGGIIELWAAEKLPGSKTRRDWETKLDRFAKFLHTDDAAMVTAEDIVRYKELLLSSELSQKSVENHLVVIKTILRFAFLNKKILTNPGDGISFNAKIDPRNSRVSFTDAERRLILTESRKADPFIRFTNWIAAFSGARIAEITEADSRDIEVIDGVPVFHIRLDHRAKGQTLKNIGAARRFPLHSAIIREGLLEYVANLPPGPLFPTLKLDRNGRRSEDASRRLGVWLRQIGIADRRKVFHSHRHGFKTLARGVMAEELHDAITGHSNGSVGRDYGHYAIPVLAEAIEKIPNPFPSK